jgi:hypothetical protein
MANRVNKVAEANAGLNRFIGKLVELDGVRMEVVTDKAGIAVERWLLPNGRNVVIFGTPHWRDAFVSGEMPQNAAEQNTWEASFRGLDHEAKKGIRAIVETADPTQDRLWKVTVKVGGREYAAPAMPFRIKDYIVLAKSDMEAQTKVLNAMKEGLALSTRVTPVESDVFLSTYRDTSNPSPV